MMGKSLSQCSAQVSRVLRTSATGGSLLHPLVYLLIISCYMASVMQTLFALTGFRQRYLSDTALTHIQTCDNPLPASCVECQMLKLGDGLVSGRYSHRAKAPPPSQTDFDASSERPKFQEGVKPSQFKALIGRGHEEFSTMRQQDSEEFLQHLIDRLRAEAKRQGRGEDVEATRLFRFGMEQRLQCTECKRVGYKSEAVDLASLPVEAVDLGTNGDGKKLWKGVKLDECLDTLCATEELADYSCESCGKKVQAEKWVDREASAYAYRSTKFESFPDLLVLHMKKFQLVNWMPTKLGMRSITATSPALTVKISQSRYPNCLVSTDW